VINLKRIESTIEGNSYLMLDNEEQCFSTIWSLFFTLSITILMTYLMFVIWMYWFVTTRRHLSSRRKKITRKQSQNPNSPQLNLKSLSVATQKELKMYDAELPTLFFLVHNYTVELYHYELITLMRRLILVLISVFFVTNEPYMGYLFNTAICAVFLTTHLLKLPFRKKNENRIEAISLTVLTIASLLSYILSGTVILESNSFYTNIIISRNRYNGLKISVIVLLVLQIMVFAPFLYRKLQTALKPVWIFGKKLLPKKMMRKILHSNAPSDVSDSDVQNLIINRKFSSLSTASTEKNLM